MISRATYCTREDVLAVMQVAQSPRLYPAIDHAIESATLNIDNRCHRTFHPYLASKSFRWPDPNSSAWSWRLWLDGNDLVSITTLVSGLDTVTDFFLEPQQYGPPYTHVEINTASTDAFSAGDTNQRAIVITGLWGHSDTTQAVTTLEDAIVSTTAGTLTVTDGSAVGVGDLLLIGTERMIVTGRELVTSGQTLQTPLTASAAGTAVAVTTGSAFHAGEVITLDAEQMLITSIASNTLVVERAVNSTVLAAHTAPTIFVPRVLQVERGVNGSTAATHLDAAVVSRSVVPAPVRSLALAEAIVEVQQGTSAYARTAGSGDNQRPVGAGPGLTDLRDQVETGYRRKVRMRVV